MKGILGKKIGMTQIYDENGQVIPVTVIEAGPCFVTQIRTKERDGYNAVQLGFEQVKPKYLREFPLEDGEELTLGQRIDVSVFEVGELVDVTGVSKGRGFAGGIKRHNFNRQRKTHGQSDRERAPGSLGAGTSPGRGTCDGAEPESGDGRPRTQSVGCERGCAWRA